MKTPPHHFFPPNGLLTGMIHKHFPDYRGYCIDIGASDGVSVNTTYVLEKQYHWTVLSVEANPAYKPYLDSNRAFVEICACGSNPQTSCLFHVHLDNPESFSALEVNRHPLVKPKPNSKWGTIKVPVRTVEQLLRKWEFPKLDCLCIDTEGTEPDVLASCDVGKWQPKIIVVEAWDKDAPIHGAVRALGYSLVDTTVQNYVYLRGKR
jgi:FkbM family methyltransferase